MARAGSPWALSLPWPHPRSDSPALQLLRVQAAAQPAAVAAAHSLHARPAPPPRRRFLEQERQEMEYTLRVLQQEASPYKT